MTTLPPPDSAVVRRVLQLARLAPSAHNAQPWRVLLRDDGMLQVSADESRHLKHSDPGRRDLELSLGGFVEAVRLAALSEGVKTRDEEATSGAFAALRLEEATTAEPKAASVLRMRQTSRLDHSPRELEPEVLRALEAEAKQHGLRMHWFARGTPERKKVQDWLFASSRESWLDVRSVRELKRWIRFDPEGTRPPEDGLSTETLGLNAIEGAALRALLEERLWQVASFLYVAPVIAGTLARQEVQQAETSACLGVLIADDAANRHGGGLLHVWLEATRQRLALHPTSVVLDRRGWDLSKHLGVKPGQLVSMFRLGRSAPPPRAHRLPVERFASL